MLLEMGSMSFLPISNIMYFSSILLFCRNLGSPNKRIFVIFFPLRSNTAKRRMTLLMIKIIGKLFTWSFAPFVVGIYSLRISQVPGILYEHDNVCKNILATIHASFYSNTFKIFKTFKMLIVELKYQPKMAR